MKRSLVLITFFAVAFSRIDGTYSVGVLPDSWALEPSSGGLMQLGYLGWKNGINVSTVAGNVANFDLPVDPATALVYGTLKNRRNDPVVGVELEGSDPRGPYNAWGSRTLPPNAEYCVGVRPGSWQIGPTSESIAPLGYTGHGATVTARFYRARVGP